MTPVSPDVMLQIALDAPLDQLFDYLAPDATEADIGRRVTVPFGRQKKVGVAVALCTHTDVPAANLKAVQSIDRTTPPLPVDLIQLAQFAAQYYRHPLGAVLTSLLPPALRRTDSPRRNASQNDSFQRTAPPVAYTLTTEGLQHTARISKRAFAQQALAEKLATGPCLHAGLSPQEKTLLRDWLKKTWVIADRISSPSIAPAGLAPELSAQQQAALGEISAHRGFVPWLLHGVTGSGKTEIYLHQVETVLAAKQQALILVPEIHLTPQLTERFTRRFPNQRLLSLHSGLADGERRSAWLAAMAGEADIVLGTRLAVFTPMPRLGLIVVDEEHDPAFKQMEGMRYSARDVAVWRAKQRNVPIILGSATPALESWRNAQEGRYTMLSLTHRARTNAVLPSVRLVDSRTDRPRNGLTQTLLNALKERLARGEQSLVFINRRGYAPTLLCNGCGHVFPCPRCSAHLVLHQGRRQGQHAYQLLCHHCGLVTRPPEVCPECGNVDLRPAGQGTQRVEETLQEHFPEARLLRIDRDTAARKGAFAAMREQVEAREVDILIGTQIVAKGHDFPHLTLVGVIGADQALVSPDFRAGERVFSQLMQVAGRAGRADHPGEVLIQTAFPQHPLYQAIVAHDYPGYAKQALRERRGADFPPYASQVLLRAEGRDEQAVLAFLHAARNIGETFSTRANVLIFDPVAALMSRVANRHRMQLLAQSAARAHLQKFLDFWVPKLRELPANGVRWGLDVDPLDV